ncbi:hypothetical protein C5H24_12835 [Xylella fastidiosa]|nr:hypothetical protein C5H24_12835 [Xylella fastidiosa]
MTLALDNHRQSLSDITFLKECLVLDITWLCEFNVHQCELYKGIPSFPIQGDSPIAVKTDTGYSHPFSLLLPCSEASTKIEVAQEMAG